MAAGTACPAPATAREIAHVADVHHEHRQLGHARGADAAAGGLRQRRQRQHARLRPQDRRPAVHRDARGRLGRRGGAHPPGDRSVPAGRKPERRRRGGAAGRALRAVRSHPDAVRRSERRQQLLYGRRRPVRGLFISVGEADVLAAASGHPVPGSGPVRPRRDYRQEHPGGARRGGRAVAHGGGHRQRPAGPDRGSEQDDRFGGGGRRRRHGFPERPGDPVEPAVAADGHQGDRPRQRRRDGAHRHGRAAGRAGSCDTGLFARGRGGRQDRLQRGLDHRAGRPEARPAGFCRIRRDQGAGRTARRGRAGRG